VRVGVYLRLSDDRDGTSTATERQRADCTSYAKNKGWTVADVFEDIDVSAYKRSVKRPEFERMLIAVRERQIDGVLSWKIDRFTRRQRDLVRLDEQCEEVGACILTVIEGIDTRQPTGRFVAELLVAQARMESENTSVRVTRAHEQMAKSGRPALGGTRAFGYNLSRETIIAEEADLIHEAVARVLAGEGITTICMDWERRGVKSPAGKAWRQTPLRRILTNPMLSGQREYRGIATPGTWPPILTSDETAQVRAILLDPARRNNMGNARSYLLSGFLRCGRCGGRLVSRPRGDKVHRYICGKAPGTRNCGKLARLAEPVEELVKEAVLIALNGVDLRAYIEKPRGETDGLVEAVRADEEGLEQLSRDHYVERRIERAEYFAARDALQARLGANRKRLAKANGHGVLAGVIGAADEVRRQWHDHGLDWKRAVIGALVDHIVIEPARKGHRRFDPSLVRIVWRF